MVKLFSAVLRATMPKASVNEHSNSSASEHNVGFSADLVLRRDVNPKTQSVTVQESAHR